jgi:hypothetical protein
LLAIGNSEEKKKQLKPLTKETQGYPPMKKDTKTPASKYPKQTVAQHATHESNYEIKSSCAKSSDRASLQPSSREGVSLSFGSGAVGIRMGCLLVCLRACVIKNQNKKQCARK